MNLALIAAVVLGSIAFVNAYVVAEASQGSDPALVVASVIIGALFFFIGTWNVIAKYRRNKIPLVVAG